MAYKRCWHISAFPDHGASRFWADACLRPKSRLSSYRPHSRKTTHLLLPVQLVISSNKVPHKIPDIHLVHLPADHPFHIISKSWRIIFAHMQPLPVKLRILRLGVICIFGIVHTRQKGSMIINRIEFFARMLILLLLPYGK